MIFPESEMITRVCDQCNGSGIVDEPGFFTGTTTGKKITCPKCDGLKIIKRIIPECQNKIYYPCRGDLCNLWDRDKGGCLEKKAFLKQLGR